MNELEKLYIPKKELKEGVEEEGYAVLTIVNFMHGYNMFKVNIAGMEQYDITSGFIGVNMYKKYKKELEQKELSFV